MLGKCANARNQDWAAFGRFELRNAADGKCLTDPGGSLKAGTAVDVTNMHERQAADLVASLADG